MNEDVDDDVESSVVKTMRMAMMRTMANWLYSIQLVNYYSMEMMMMLMNQM